MLRVQLLTAAVRMLPDHSSHFGKDITLTGDWVNLTIPFSELGLAWADPTPGTTFDPRRSTASGS